MRAISSEVKNRTAKMSNGSSTLGPGSSFPTSGAEAPESKSTPYRHHHHHTAGEHETKVKEAGTSRRNITRKKGEGSTQLYDSRNKKQGGAGYVYVGAFCVSSQS